MLPTPMQPMRGRELASLFANAGVLHAKYGTEVAAAAKADVFRKSRRLADGFFILRFYPENES